MHNRLKEYFPHCEEKECLEYRKDKKFEIIDDKENEKCYIVAENGQFKVINQKEKTVGFVAIDDCLFDSSDSSRADCFIFDDKIVSFIELKNCKNKNIKKNRKKAKSQLVKTIEFFSEIIKDKKLEAYICITCTKEDGTITMTPRASNIEVQLEFEELYNTQLFYECLKEY